MILGTMIVLALLTTPTDGRHHVPRWTQQQVFSGASAQTSCASAKATRISKPNTEYRCVEMSDFIGHAADQMQEMHHTSNTAPPTALKK
jgi:hypothetical protein